jgi:hypothetical protein
LLSGSRKRDKDEGEQRAETRHLRILQLWPPSSAIHSARFAPEKSMCDWCRWARKIDTWPQ